MPKCTRAPLGQPARRAASHVIAATAVGLLVALTSADCLAQSASGDSELLAAPAGRTIATVKSGAPLVLGAVSGDYTFSGIEGWLAAPLLGPARDSFPVSVAGNRGARLRASASPNASVVATLQGGVGLIEVERRGAWVHVRCTGWVRTSRVSNAPSTMLTGAQAPASPPAAPAEAATDTTTVDDSKVPLSPAVETGLSVAPDGDRIATVLPGARATVTGRDRGWVRVRIEGWARERDFAVADTSLKNALSAADLRADPDGTRGRLVHWDVQVLAHQVADPLRKGLSNGEPYLLAQGPGRENALLYLAIPTNLAATAREIPDMTTVTITARVRVGKSEPVGVPVLDLLTIVRR